MNTLIAKRLNNVPERALPIIKYIRDIHPHVILTKPVTNHMLNLIGNDIKLVQWLASIYVDACLQHSADAVESRLNKYYYISSEILDSSTNIALDDDDRALQHITLEQINNITHTCGYIKAIHLIKLTGVLDVEL